MFSSLRKLSENIKFPGVGWVHTDSILLLALKFRSTLNCQHLFFFLNGQDVCPYNHEDSNFKEGVICQYKLSLKCKINY